MSELSWLRAGQEQFQYLGGRWFKLQPESFQMASVWMQSTNVNKIVKQISDTLYDMRLKDLSAFGMFFAYTQIVIWTCFSPSSAPFQAP